MSNLTKRPVCQRQLKAKKARKPIKRRKKREEDREYLDWLKTQPCCHCHKPPPSDPAHVRLGGRGGMATKPKFSAVPLCHEAHLLQHQKGHLAIMPTEEWLMLADIYLEQWRKFK